jgi:site-specific DNA-cytosine methylase
LLALVVLQNGLESTGRFETVYANDMSEKCKTTYDLNNKIDLTVADINTISPSSILPMDILTAGKKIRIP